MIIFFIPRVIIHHHIQFSFFSYPFSFFSFFSIQSIIPHLQNRLLQFSSPFFSIQSIIPHLQNRLICFIIITPQQVIFFIIYQAFHRY